jgi:hypothetical protein
VVGSLTDGGGSFRVSKIASVFALITSPFWVIQASHAQTGTLSIAYDGPAKTNYVVDVAKRVAVENGLKPVPDLNAANIYLFLDDDVFSHLREKAYVQRRFANSPGLQKLVFNWGDPGRICATVDFRSDKLTYHTVILADASLPRHEVESCVASMIRGSIHLTASRRS